MNKQASAGGSSLSSAIQWVVLLAAVAAAGFLLRDRIRSALRGPEGDLKAAVGRRLVDFRASPLTFQGDGVTLDDLAGDVTLVNFWGTWCPPCAREFPHLAALEAKMRDVPGFRMISVSCGAGEETFVDLKAETEAFLADQAFGAGVYWDPGGVSRLAVMETTGVEFAYPFTLLIDGEGRIAGLWRGYVEGDILEMEHLAKSLLKERAAAESPEQAAKATAAK